MEWNLYMNFFAAMMAIINPIGIWPIWSELTNDAVSGIRNRVAAMVLLTAFIILVIFLVSGKYLLGFFSIDLPVFKVAGGILLLITGISMIQGSATQLSNRREDGQNSLSIARQRFEKIVVPLAIPMLAGPGSITTVVLYGAQAESVISYLVLMAVVFISLLSLFVVFVYSSFMEKHVDRIVFTIFTRIFGIIVTAIAVQFMLEGLGEVFPAWMQGGASVLEHKQETSL